ETEAGPARGGLDDGRAQRVSTGSGREHQARIDPRHVTAGEAPQPAAFPPRLLPSLAADGGARGKDLPATTGAAVAGRPAVTKHHVSGLAVPAVGGALYHPLEQDGDADAGA